MKATQSFLCSAIAINSSATVAEASPAIRRPISVSSVFLNFWYPVILSESATFVPSTPPVRLDVEIIEPPVVPEENSTLAAATEPHAEV